MDEQNLQLQRMLHEQNQERMRAIEEQQRKQGELLTKIASNTECLPDMASRIDSLESSRDKQKGGLALLGALWGGLEAFFHIHK